MAQIFKPELLTNVTSIVTDTLSQNMGIIVGIFALFAGLSIVLALFMGVFNKAKRYIPVDDDGKKIDFGDDDPDDPYSDTILRGL